MRLSLAGAGEADAYMELGPTEKPCVAYLSRRQGHRAMTTGPSHKLQQGT